MDALLRAWGRFVVESRKGVTAGLVLLTLVSVALFGRFEFESDLATFFPSDHEAVELRRLIAGDNTSSERMLVVLRGDDIESRIPEIVERLRQCPLLDGVVATKEEFLGQAADIVRRAPVPFLPPRVLGQLEARLTGPERDAVLDDLVARIADDPLLGLELARRDPLRVREILQDYAQQRVPSAFDRASPYLVLNDRKTAFVRVEGRYRAVDMTRTHELLDDLEEKLSDVDHELIGGYVIARESERQMRWDLISSMTGAFILISIFLALSTRRRLDPILLMIPCSLVLIWALGIGGALFGPLTPLAAGAAAVLAGLNVDFAIHYLGRFREEVGRRPLPDAIRETTRHAGLPLAISMATTVVAFSSLAGSQFHGLWTFGAVLALGVFLSFVSALTLLPIVLQRVHERPSGSESAIPPSRVVDWATRLFDEKRGGWVVVATLVLCVGGWISAFSGGLSFDADPNRLRPADDPVMNAARELEDQLELAPFPIAVLVPGTVSADQVTEAFDRLEKEGWIRTSLGHHRTTPTSVGRQAALEFRSRISGWIDSTCVALEERDLVAAALRGTLEELDALLHRDPAPLPADLRVWRGAKFQLFQMLATRTPWTPDDRGALESATQAALGVEGTTPTKSQVHVIAAIGLSDELTEVLTSDLVQCGSIAAVGVLVIVLLLTRGRSLAWIALTPTFAGIGLVFGTLAMTGTPIHLGNVVVIPFLIGLGIDDGVHMVSRFREELLHGDSRATAVHRTLASSGAAIWRTSATTFLGFGSLIFATSPALQSLGTLMAIGIATCFVTSLVIIPRLVPASISLAESEASRR